MDNKIDLRDIEIVNAQAFEKDKVYMIEFQIDVSVPKEIIREFSLRIKQIFDEKGINLIPIIKFKDTLEIKAVEVTKDESL